MSTLPRHPQNSWPLTSRPIAVEAKPLRPLIVDHDGMLAHSIPSRFSEQVRAHPDAIAVKSQLHSWTYREFDARSGHVAALVLAAGVPADSPVALLFEHDAPGVAAIMGLLRAGRVSVSLDSSHPLAWLETLVSKSAPSLMLCDPGHAALARTLAGDACRVLEIDPHSPIAQFETTPIVIAPKTPARILFTSGTTGPPKGVVHSHATLLHAWSGYTAGADLGPNDRMTLLASMAVSASSSAILGALLNGATLYPVNLLSRGVDDLARLCRQECISVMHMAPTVFRHFARAVGGPDRLPDLRVLRLGGEAIRATDVRMFRSIAPPNALLQITLSSTETYLIAQHVIGPRDDLPPERVPVGSPLPGMDVLILDEHGRPSPIGKPGRLAVRSRFLATGYWRDPEATQAGFVADPSDPSMVTFTSNDLVRRRDDGLLEHLGRADATVKVRGHRVDLAAVETMLMQAPGIRDAAVAIRAAASDREDRLIAYVVPQALGSAHPEQTRQWLARRLPASMVPDVIVPMRFLPLTAGGKLDRAALPAPPRLPAARPRFRPLRDPIEKDLGFAWESILGISGVGRDDNFFDLGATSIQTAQLVSRIERVFGQEFTVSAIAESATLAVLASRLAQRIPASSRQCLVALRSSGAKRPFFCAHPAGGQIGAMIHTARHMDPHRPFYAFQAPGAAGAGWPLGSIPALAARYISEMKSIQPTGPFLIGGLCLGGIIAWEMARQLTAQGERVGLVVLWNTTLARPGVRRRGFARRVADAVREAARVGRWAMLSGIDRLLGGRLGVHHSAGFRRFVFNRLQNASRLYNPAPYAGRVAVMMTASGGASDLADDQLLPRNLATGEAFLTRDVLEPWHELRRLLDEAEDRAQ